MPFLRFLTLLLAWMLAGALHAQPVKADHVEAELVTAADAVQPGQALTVALRLKHDPLWHTYWQVPGDSGLPTRIEWQLPAGWSAGPIQWPVPKRLPIGPLMNYGYEGETFLLTELTPPPGVKPGAEAVLRGRADWLVCREVCIPGGADLQLTVPVRSEVQTTRWAASIALARSKVPKPVQLAQAQATVELPRVRLAFQPDGDVRKLEFFPLDEARIEAAAPQTPAPRGRRPGAVSAGSRAPQARTSRRCAASWSSTAGRAAPAGGRARSTCRSSPAASPRSAAHRWSMPRPSRSVPHCSERCWAVCCSISCPASSRCCRSSCWRWSSMIAKTMPRIARMRACACTAWRTRRAWSRPSSCSPAVLLALRQGGAQLGWGFQLQSPWVVVVLAAAVLRDRAEPARRLRVHFGSRLASSAAAQRLQGSTLTRQRSRPARLATVVAAPCTAPFMGAALGYAITQPAPMALAVFAALGFGMALPYLLLTGFPALLARLPRPGAWMETLQAGDGIPDVRHDRLARLGAGAADRRRRRDAGARRDRAPRPCGLGARPGATGCARVPLARGRCRCSRGLCRHDCCGRRARGAARERGGAARRVCSGRRGRPGAAQARSARARRSSSTSPPPGA